MIYHYTTLQAFMSILRDAATRAQMCFWATRYDCFADAEEYKLGVETILRLLPEVEKDIPTDRKIAPLFEWGKIKDNQNLPYPYVVSFTSRPDNDYMWHKYAKEDGVVLEIDDMVRVEVPGAPLLRLVSCIYTDDNSGERVIEMLRQEYNEVGYKLLGGLQKEMAFGLLKNYPQLFVKLIATGLLSVTAPRIKGAKNFWMEEETRAIIPFPVSNYNSLIEGHEEMISRFGLNPVELRKLVANECTRQRSDGSIVYYREMHLPIHLLKRVCVKSKTTGEAVERFFAELELSIPVSRM